MNYSFEDGELIRVCSYCLDGTSDNNKFVYEPHHEETQCIYCDSWDTKELKPDWGKFECNNCHEIFRRF